MAEKKSNFKPNPNKPAPVEIEFMGQTAKMVAAYEHVTEKGEKFQKPTVITLTEKQKCAIADEAGYTKELRDIESNFRETVAEKALPILAEQVIAHKAPCTIKIGSGDGKITHTLNGREEDKDGNAKFGRLRSTLDVRTPKKFRDGALAETQKKIADSYK